MAKISNISKEEGEYLMKLEHLRKLAEQMKKLEVEHLNLEKHRESLAKELGLDKYFDKKTITKEEAEELIKKISKNPQYLKESRLGEYLKK